MVSLIFSLFALTSGDVGGKIFAKLDRYVSAGKGVSVQSQNKEKGYSLSYLDVFQPLRKPVKFQRKWFAIESWQTVRLVHALDACLLQIKDAFIFPTAIFGLLGVVFLIFRYWEFCLAVPFLAIAHYCLREKLDCVLLFMWEISLPLALPF